MKVKIVVEAVNTTSPMFEKVRVVPLDDVVTFSLQTLMHGLRMAEEYNHEKHKMGWFNYNDTKIIRKQVALLFQIFDFLGIEYEYRLVRPNK